MSTDNLNASSSGSGDGNAAAGADGPDPRQREDRPHLAAAQVAQGSDLVSNAEGECPTPPMTNTGCFTPSEGEGVVFHLDYLKVTIFESADQVLEFVEQALLERAGLPLGGWQDKGSFDRWEHIFVGAGPIEILVPKQQRITYTIVEIKGQGCACIGAKALWSFLASLAVREWRWHGRRVDLAFDHVAFTPQIVDEAIRAGNFNSRCLNISDRDWNDSATGQTAYLGGRWCKKLRRLRVYNKHGYNRCEGEFRGDWASGVVRKLSETPLDGWPLVALSFLRGMVDFIHRQANERVERCPLLSWWAAFVGSADRIRNLPPEDRRKNASDAALHAVGKSESRIIRCARSLWAIGEAFGRDYLWERIQHYALPKLTDEDRAFAAELAKLQYSGLAGLSGEPPDPDDIPF